MSTFLASPRGDRRPRTPREPRSPKATFAPSGGISPRRASVPEGTEAARRSGRKTYDSERKNRAVRPAHSFFRVDVFGRLARPRNPSLLKELCRSQAVGARFNRMNQNGLFRTPVRPRPAASQCSVREQRLQKMSASLA